MMKKIFLISLIVSILGVSILNAQVIRGQKDQIENLPNFDKRTLRFGFYLGMNNNSYKISYYDQSGQDLNSPINPIPSTDMFVSVDASLGFNLGFVIDYRLHQNISLRFEPGLMSNTKQLTFINPNLDSSDSNGIPIYTGTDVKSRDLSSTYLHLPLLLKFSTNRYKNVRPYIIGGASYDYNFSSNEKNTKDNYDAEFRMTSSNFMYEVGIGMDFYFYYFKFSPSIRGIFAINNEMVPDSSNKAPYSSPWTGPIDYFGTRGVYLNLTFQ